VNPDCTGTQTISVAGAPDLHIQFIVAQSGNTIHQVVTDPGGAVTEMLSKGAINAAAHRGGQTGSKGTGNEHKKN
jgi:hypothetical protein